MKEKKKKVKTEGRKKWAVWKTIVVTISSVVAVVGATVLGVYATGGFDTKRVAPADISFSTDNLLYNFSTSQFEVTEKDEFYLTITSSTQHVTETSVTLYFEGSFDSGDGMITDRIITVPEIVNIGVPFKVTLNQATNNEIGSSWTRGGISNLFARSNSSNVEIQPTSTRIAVDVPVYDVQTVLCDMDGNEITGGVVVGSHFIAKNKFIPAASEYLYSDNINSNITAENKRTRQSYFVANGQVAFEYDEQQPYFVAENTAAGNTITGYTFAHANDMIEVIERLSKEHSGNQLYGAILTELTKPENIDKMSKRNTIEFEIVRAAIGQFKIENSSIHFQSGRNHTLTVGRSELADAYLGASVLSTSGDELSSLYGQIGLRFVKDGHEANSDFTTIGGKTMTVSSDDGDKHFILPDTNLPDLRNAKWTIFTRESGFYTIEVVLFVEDPDNAGVYQIFANGNSPIIHTINLSIAKLNESEVGWLIGDKVDIKLSMGESAPNPQNYSFAGSVDVPEDNIFKDVKFFARFDGINSKSDLDKISSQVNGMIDTSSLDLEHAGDYTFGQWTYFLIPLFGDNFTATGEGSFKIFFATVRTNLNGFELDNGKFVIANSSQDAVTINISKSLHANSITGGEITLAQQTAGEEIFIPEGDRSFDITLTLTINDDSVALMQEANSKGQLSLAEVKSGEKNILKYFNIKESKLDVQAKTLTYVLNVASGITETENLAITGVVVRDAGSELSWNKTFANKNIKIYKPSIDQATVEISSAWPANQDIVVKQILDENGNFNVTIEGYNDIEEFKSAIKSSIKIVDQNGNDKTLTDWRFASNGSNVTISSDGKDFSFAGIGDSQITLTYNSKTLSQAQPFTLKVSSVGVVAYKYDTSPKLNTKALSEKQANTDNSIDDVEKYGAKDGEIILKNLVELYLNQPETQTTDDEENEKQFTNFKFLLDLDLLGNDDFEGLFGINGMLKLNGKVFASKSELQGLAINTIEIRHNFASNPTIHFNIVDQNDSGAVKIGFKLNIKANIKFEETGSGEVTGNAETTLSLNNYFLKYLNEDKTESVKSPSGQIVENSDGTYSIVETAGATDQIEGRVDTNGMFIFNDFWNEATKTFAVKIYPEGQNAHTLSFNIKFVIARNVQVQAAEKVFKLTTASSDNLISSFINVERLSQASTSINGSISYEFVGSSQRLVIDGNVLKLDEKGVAFEYNEQEKVYDVRVKIDGYEVGTAKLKVTLGLSYSDLSSIFEVANQDVEASTIIHDNCEYLYLPYGVDENPFEWRVNNIVSGGLSYTIETLKQNTNHTNIKYHSIATLYEVTAENGVSSIKIQQNVINTTLYGLDNDNSYILLKVKQNGKTLANIVVPTIISHASKSKQFVVYDEMPKDMSNLTLALTSGETLIENGVYKQVKAGDTFTLAHNEKDFAANSEGKFGFIYDGDYTNVSTNLSIAKDEFGICNNISGHEITLNHLDKSIADPVYLVLRFSTTYSSSSAVFYYVLKVMPDVQVQEAIYAYDGEAEYVVAENKTLTLDLNQTFSNITLHPGETRFNVLDSEGNKINPAYSHKIVKIIDKHKGTIYTTEEEFKKVAANIYVDGSGVLHIEGIELETEFTLTLARVYDGGENGLSIVGGQTYYSVIVNSSNDFSLVYNTPSDFDVKVNGNNLTWNASANDGKYVYNSENANDENNYIIAPSDKVQNVDEETFYLSKKNTTFLRWTNKIPTTLDGNTTLDAVDFVCEEVAGETKYLYASRDDGDFYLDANDAEAITNYQEVEASDGKGHAAYKFNSKTALFVKNGENFEPSQTAMLAEDYEIKRSLQIVVTLKSIEGGVESPDENGTLKVRGASGSEDDFAYDPSTNVITMFMPAFLDTQTQKTCLLYTAYGLTGTISVDMSPTYDVQLKEVKSFGAGQSLSFEDFKNKFIKQVTEGQNDVTTIANITKIEVTNSLIKVDNDNKTITFYSSISDYDIKFNVTLQIGESKDKTVTFPVETLIKANITQASNSNLPVGTDENSAQVITGSAIYAGQSREVQNLFDGNKLNDEIIKYDIDSSALTVIENQEDQERVAFTPNNVSNNGTTVTLTIRVKVYKDSSDKKPQVFFVKYVVEVLCNARIDVSYPNPTGTKAFDSEYLEAGLYEDANSITNAQFDYARLFTDNKALFAAEKRISVFEYNSSTGIFASSISMPEIYVSELTDAKVFSGTKELTIVEGNNIIDTNLPLKFYRTSATSDGRVVLKLVFNGYETEYVVTLVESAFALNVNGVTANTEIDNGKVSEEFFAEEVKDGKIFAENTLLKYTLSNEAKIGNYVAVFEDENGQKRIVDFVVKQNDLGKTIVIDCFEKISGALTGVYSKKTGTNPSYGSDDQNFLNNAMFKIDGQPKATSRIVMTYNGVEVSYQNYKSLIVNATNATTEPSTTESSTTKPSIEDYSIENVDLNTTIALTQFDFAINDGRSLTRTFNLNYSYTLSLDVTADLATDGTQQDFKRSEIKVGQELDILNVMAIKKKSTGERITDVSQISGATVMAYPVGDTTDPAFVNAKKFLSDVGVTSSLALYKHNPDNPFLRVMPVINGSKETESFNVLALGASNDGDYVLVKLTYQTTIGKKTFSQDFYVIFNILPTYELELNGGSVTYGLGAIPNNKGNVMTVDATNKTASANPSVKLTSEKIVITKPHESNNLSAIFTYKLVLDKENVYNEQQNVLSKISKVSGGDTGNWKLAPVWSTSDIKDGAVAFDRGAIELGFEPAYFGTKHFLFEAEDDWGFKFEFYLDLSSDTNPLASSQKVTITEGKTFDVGVQANYITIGDTQVNGKYVLSASKNQPVVSTGLPVINILGLEAKMNLFNTDPTNLTEENVSESDRQYLVDPIYQNISITNIKFVKDGKDVAELKNQNQKLKTNDAKYLKTSSTSSDTTTAVGSEGAFTLPLVANSTFWNGANSFEAKMFITLRYEEGSNIEVNTVEVPVQIQREARIVTDTDNYVRDGEAFNLIKTTNTADGQFDISGENYTIESIVNDTLEVTVPSSSTVEFSLSLIRDGNEIAPKTITRTTNGLAQTFYVLISKELGTDIQANDKIKVSVKNGAAVGASKYQPNGKFSETNSGIKNAMFGYRELTTGNWQNTTSTTTDNEFTTFEWLVTQASTSARDKLQLVSAGAVTNDGLAVRKSYIINVQKGSEISPLRYERDYVLTWNYSKHNTTEEMLNMPVVYDGTIAQGGYTASWANIIKNISFYYKDKENSGAIIDRKLPDNTMVNFPDFKVEITSEGSGSGFATLENDGRLTTTAGFDISTHYITLAFYRTVSGSDSVEKEVFLSMKLHLVAPK